MFTKLRIAYATLLFFLPLRLWAKTDTVGLPHVNGRIKWVVSGEATGRNTAQLFGDVRRWLSETYSSEMYHIVEDDDTELSGQLVTGTFKRPHKRLNFIITHEGDKYMLTLENIATYRGGTKEILGNDKAWAEIQDGFNYYFRRKVTGKNVSNFERAYRSLRMHIEERVIGPFRKMMNHNNLN